MSGIHLHAAVTIPPAVAVGVWVMWYWRRLGRAEVPARRRQIRRASLVVMLASLPLHIAGLSLLTPQIHVRGYVLVWTLALVSLGLLVGLGVLDMFNSLRLEREHRHDVHLGATRLIRAAPAAGLAASPNGETEDEPS